MNDADDAGTGVYARESDRLDRAVELGVAAGRVLSLSFPGEFPDDAGPDHPLLDRLFAYFDGEEDDFSDVTLAITVPTEQRNVLEAVRNVPYGDEVTLDLVVRMTAGLDHEDEADVAIARQALRANPVPVFVPDHRVTDAEGATPADVAEALRRIES